MYICRRKDNGHLRQLEQGCGQSAGYEGETDSCVWDQIHTDTAVDYHLKHNVGTHTGADHLVEEVFLVQGNLEDQSNQNDKEENQHQTAEDSQFFHDDGKDNVVLTLREAGFLPALSQSLAEPAAVGDGIEAVHGLVGDGVRKSFRVKPGYDSPDTEGNFTHLGGIRHISFHIHDHEDHCRHRQHKEYDVHDPAGPPPGGHKSHHKGDT